MAKLFKHLGFNSRKSSSEQTPMCTNIPQELQESTLALAKDKYCGLSAFIEFPLRSSHRRNSAVVADRLAASQESDCRKVLESASRCNLRCQHASHKCGKNTRTRASICYDSRPPLLLEVYSDPIDMKFEEDKDDGMKGASASGDVFSDDEEYSVPYQSFLAHCRNFGSEKQLHTCDQRSMRQSQSNFQDFKSPKSRCTRKIQLEGAYEEPWDLLSTKRDLAGRLEATLSSSALRPINSEKTGVHSRKTSDSTSQTVQKCACKLPRVPDDNEASHSGQESCDISKASCENDPRHMTLQSHRPAFAGLNRSCHCRHLNCRLIGQGKDHLILRNVCQVRTTQQDRSSHSRQKVKSCSDVSPWMTHNENHTEHLQVQSWYHGAISRIEAETLLQNTKEGSFLVRTSESNRKDFSLSLKSGDGFLHIKIVKENDAYVLGQFSQPFKSIPSIIQFFNVNKLPVRGTDHILLAHPVFHEPLL